MSSTKLVLRFLTIMVLAATLAACSAPSSTPTLAPTVDLQPTLNAVMTQAAQTVIANVTKSAPPTATPVTPTNTPAASSTPMPTNTPAATSTPVPTATVTYPAWTLTPTKSPYSCVITESSPSANYSIAASSSFDAKWVIKNTGTQTWLAPETDIRFLSGTNLQKAAATGMDMTADTAPNGSYTVLIDMKSPAATGSYTSTWVVITGKNTICTLNVSIVVK